MDDRCNFRNLSEKSESVVMFLRLSREEFKIFRKVTHFQAYNHSLYTQTYQPWVTIFRLRVSYRLIDTKD